MSTYNSDNPENSNQINENGLNEDKNLNSNTFDENGRLVKTFLPPVAPKKHFFTLPISNMIILGIIFLIILALLTVGFMEDKQLSDELNQKKVYSFIFAGLLSALATFFMYTQMLPTPKKTAFSIKARPTWFFPVMAGFVALFCMSLSYIYLGVYPFGEKSTLTVDLHHQYAPLLAQFRTMILEGKNPFYSFEVGLGTNFLPLFAYYLSSPFNIILVFFPATMLADAIVVITLLKNVLTAVFFAMCVQYLFKKRGLHVVISAVCYSMMMYLIAYSWNIMWLDVVMILPLVVMAYERMMRKGKFLLYILSLAYALFANYYIAFMLCIFMVLYHIIYLVREKRDMNHISRSSGRFILSSAIGGGLVMVLLIPVALSLGHTSASGGGLPDLKNNFEMFDILGRHLFDTSPTIRSGNLPNIYSGILSVVMLPLFITNKNIPKRRKMALLALLAIVGFSFIINALDLTWHGFHSPNDLPYRFSFLYSFVLLLITAESLLNIHKVTSKQILTSLAFLLVFCVFQEKFADDKYSFESIYVSLLFMGVYGLIVWLASKKYLTLYATYALTLLVVVAELTLNGGRTFKTLNSNEYFTRRNDYVISDKNQLVAKGVLRTKALGDAASNGEFYRLEFAPRHTTVDTALYNYRGLSVFASSNPQGQVKFMGGLGFAINGVNSHLYKSYVPTMDSILGIKYVMLDEDKDDIKYLKKLETVTGNSYSYTIYENTMALPIGFTVNSQFKDWSYAQYDPIHSQNSFFKALTGISEDVFTNNTDITVDYDSTDFASASGSTAFSITNANKEKKSSNFTVTVAQDGPVFAFVDCRSAKDIKVTGNGYNYTMRGYEPYIANLGNLKAGDTVKVSVETEGDSTGNIFVSSLNSDAFEKHINALNQEGLKVSTFTETNIKASISAASQKSVFTSIPYDQNWQVKIDGKAVKTYSINDAMLGFDVGAGEHNVEISFIPKPFYLGLIVSLISLGGLIALLVISSKKKSLPLEDSLDKQDYENDDLYPSETTENLSDDVLTDEISLDKLSVSEVSLTNSDFVNKKETE